MKKLTYCFPVKLAAVFLLVFSALGTGVFAMAIIVDYALGFYRVSVYATLESAIEYLGDNGIGHLGSGEIYLIRDNYMLFNTLIEIRYAAIALSIVFLIVSILLFIYLMCAAGRRPGSDTIALSMFDRIPFDLTLCLAGFVLFILFQMAYEMGYVWIRDDPVIYFIFVAVIGVVMLLVALWVFYTFAARAKAGKWWRNTVIFFVLSRVFKWLRSFFRFMVRMYHAVRLEWRVAIAVVGMAFLSLISLLFADSNRDEASAAIFFLQYGAAFAVLVFSAYQFRLLRSAGEKLAAGELEYKVDTSKMYFDFRLHGEDLNSIGEGMSAAVEQRMRSERLKTELITNVSHDIKTPLTSIVNYVDLLRKDHSPEEEAQYLDVLKRQSDKLRRLTVDLVEASKASTGNLPTELVPTNTLELINQAVAEYADRFEQGQLEPVITSPEKPVTVLADGRHLWRVLDNLFNNAIKYAQPGTRVYIDVRRLDGGALISVKNISRERLNVSSDELMERFVRGDESRHTEGSGLGLSIARSLTELMGGSFDIVIDGDLFKAEIRLKLV